MARIVKYLILIWNYVNYSDNDPATIAVVEHYRRVTKKYGDVPPFKKGRTLYELWLTGDLTPAFKSEGVTMT